MKCIEVVVFIEIDVSLNGTVKKKDSPIFFRKNNKPISAIRSSGVS